MATEGKSYPKLSRKLWWGVRARFMKSLPSTVTPALISSISDMSDSSARSNVLAPLRMMGLVEDDGSPTDIAKKWRLDEDYAEACSLIRTRVYPTELIEAYPNPTEDQKPKIASWFMKNASVGDAAAKMYADNYILISEADPTKQNENGRANGKVSTPTARALPPRRNSAEKKQNPSAAKVGVSAQPAPTPDGGLHNNTRRLPSIHIDVQVHISPDSTPEQIDKIFESMARHLGGYVK